MKMIRLGITFFLLSLCSWGHACEPCASMLSLEDSLNKADLVVIAEKKDEGPHTAGNGLDKSWGGPDWYEVSVKEILKGSEDREAVRINGWDGMCLYGVNLKEKEYILILQRASKETRSHEPIDYHSVDFGCAVSQLEIFDGKVLYEKETLMLGDLKNKISGE